MKKRKFKLISTVAAMAMVLGVMGVGVYAATSQSLAITTTVSFTAKNVSVNVNGNLTCDYLDTTSASNKAGFYSSSTLLSNGVTGTSDTKTYASLFTAIATTGSTTGEVSLKVNLDDKNEGKIPSGTTITVTYQIVNTSTTDDLYFKYAEVKDGSTTVVEANAEPTITSSVSTYFNALTSSNIVYTGFASDSAWTNLNKYGYKLTHNSNGNATGTIAITLTAKTDIATSLDNVTLLNPISFAFYNAYGQLDDKPYSVTFNLSNYCSKVSGDTTATKGVDYVATLEASERIVAIDSITVGGQTLNSSYYTLVLTDSTDYIYTLTIQGSAITGSITISARGAGSSHTT